MTRLAGSSPALDVFDLGTLALTPNRYFGPHVEAKMCPVRLPWPTPSQDQVFDEAQRFLISAEDIPSSPYRPNDKNSGVTWGVGYDAGQQTAENIRSTWSKLSKKDLDALEETAGLKGSEAEKKLPDVSDITITKQLSLEVFRATMLPRYYGNAKNVFPGIERLPAATQAALLSLVFNRGTRTFDKSNKKHADIMDRYWEVRRIQEGVASGDLPEIAKELRLMSRVWAGTTIAKGMRNRRENEATLVDRDIALTQPMCMQQSRPTFFP